MRVGLTRRITMATLFGVLIFVSKIIIPTPFDKMAIAPQTLLLTLGFLSIGPLGATYVAVVGGLAGWGRDIEHSDSRALKLLCDGFRLQHLTEKPLPRVRHPHRRHLERADSWISDSACMVKD